ncbi:MAG: MATE family efflux transporter [Clostridia bacterium]|nr:MATE family efflux transporter [Clostridia bacterium]
MIQTKKTRDFTVGPILPQIIKFSIPLMITGVMQLLFNTADTVMVGRWGGATPEECENALAAVGSCGSLINLIVILFANLSLGAGVSVAQDIGSKNWDGVQKTVHTSVVLAFFSSVVVMLIGFIGARPLLILMGTDPAVLDGAAAYMVAYFCGIPATMLYNYCSAILRNSGETVRPLRYLLVAGIVNVGLNFVMVLVFHLGAMGVGIATAASLWVSCILIVVHMMRTDACYRLDWRKLGIDVKKLKIILRIGIPAGVQGMIFSFSHVMIQSPINSFGKAVVAGNAAAVNIDGYAYQPMNAIYQVAVTFVAQHKGAKKFQRMKKCILLCVLSVVVVGMALCWTILALGPYLLQFYVPGNPEAIEAGMARMNTALSVYFLCGLMEVGSGIMRGLGRSTTSMVTSLVGSVAFRIVWILWIFPLNPTLTMLYLSYPIAWVLTSCAHYILSFFAVRQEIRKAEQERVLDSLEQPQAEA